MAKIGEIKKIACLNLEQQDHYDHLVMRQRLYCDYRALGYGKRDAYVKAGYKATKSSPQAAYILEKSDPMLASIIETILNEKRAKSIYLPESEIGKQLNATIINNNVNEILDTVKNATPEVAEQIQFYRDIATGKIKGERKTTFVDRGGVKSYKLEKIDDLKARMDARKELDKILGINKFVEIGAVEMGDITINIVDTSKKDKTDNEKPLNSIFKTIKEEETIILNEKDYKRKIKEDDDGEPKENFYKRGVV